MPHLSPRGNHVEIQNDDDTLGLIIHFVAEEPGHLDDGEGLQLLVVESVVELGGKTRVNISKKQYFVLDLPVWPALRSYCCTAHQIAAV